jgi:hypothetical protein
LWHTVNNLIKRGHCNATGICCRPRCEHYRDMMQKRYGTLSFPCEHTAMVWKANHQREIPALPEICITPGPTYSKSYRMFGSRRMPLERASRSTDVRE